jgi:hypothetical protein
MTPTVRCYAYVDRPYEGVRRLLRERALDVFRCATRSAAARANALGETLYVGTAGISVGVDIDIEIRTSWDEAGVAGLSPVTLVNILWKAAHGPSFFPSMAAELSVWPMTHTETQLTLEGTYRPPLGPLGSVVNAAVGHRIVEAAVHRFLDDVARELRAEIPSPAGP